MSGLFSDFSYAEIGENAIAMRDNDGVVEVSHFSNQKAEIEDFGCEINSREGWRIASRICRCLDRYGTCTLKHQSGHIVINSHVTEKIYLGLISVAA